MLQINKLLLMGENVENVELKGEVYSSSVMDADDHSFSSPTISPHFSPRFSHGFFTEYDKGKVEKISLLRLYVVTKMSLRSAFRRWKYFNLKYEKVVKVC